MIQLRRVIALATAAVLAFGVLTAGAGVSADEPGPSIEEEALLQVVLDISAGLGDVGVVDGRRTRPVDVDWNEFVDLLQITPSQQIQGRQNWRSSIDIPVPATVLLETVPGSVPEVFATGSFQREIVPVFEDSILISSFEDLLVWRGKGVLSASDLILTFAFTDDFGWVLGAGSMFTPDGTPWVFETDFELGETTMREVLDSDNVTDITDPSDEPLDPGGGGNLVVERDSSISAGNQRIDLLAVGLNGPVGDGNARLTATKTATFAQNGASELTQAMDNSSSATWDATGVRFRVVGVYMAERPFDGSSFNDRDFVDDDPAIQDAADSVGADLHTGLRELVLWESGATCGRAELPGDSSVTSTNASCAFTYVHEVGHNLWAEHNFAGSNGSDRTIMSTGTGTRYLEFSSPERFFPGTSDPTSPPGSQSNIDRVIGRADNAEGERPSVSVGDGRYQALDTPVRVIDTRDGTGGNDQSFVSGETRRIPLLTPDMPQGATAAVVNVLVLPQSNARGFVRMEKFVSSQDPSVLNFQNDRKSATTIVEMRTDQTAELLVDIPGDLSGRANVIVDVFGYFGDGDSRMHGLNSPDRLSDERMSPSSVRKQDVGSSCPGTGTLGAAIVNVTVAGANSLGFIRIGDSAFDAASGDFSVLNHVANRPTPNIAIIPINSAGEFWVYSDADARVIVDLFGCMRTGFGGAELLSEPAPAVIYDSRSFGAALGPDGERRQDYGSYSASEVYAFVNLTGIDRSPQSVFFRGFAADVSPPDPSILNVAAGRVDNNHALIRISSSDEFIIQRSPDPGETDIIISKIATFVS